MELNKIWNESNDVTMKEHIDEKSIDVILTSPPYNNSRNRDDEIEGSYDPNDKNCIGGYHKRYDIYEDMRTTEEYCDWIVSIFNLFDKILKNNGTVLWNTSYQAENNECAVWLSIADIIRKTNFCVVDHMIWKKKTTLPITQKNKLSKLCEDVFIFARKDEWLDFNTNKIYLKSSDTGQKYYAPIYNIIEAKNNDELCPYNKATFSTDFVKKLLKIYAPKNGVVYDPFMGSGTTALACKQMGLSYIGSELSPNQCEWAENRIKNGKGARTQDLNKEDIFDL
jgi:DNA modification methylase